MAQLNDTLSDEMQAYYNPTPGDLQLKDSGERRNFETGAVRDTATGKGRFDLLMPHAILRVAQTLEKGAVKYADRNWEKGIPLSRFIDSGMRHLFQYLGGARDEDHLAQAAWNILALIETQHRINKGLLSKSLDDLPAGEVEFFADKVKEALVLKPVDNPMPMYPDVTDSADKWPAGVSEKWNTCCKRLPKDTTRPFTSLENLGIPLDRKRTLADWEKITNVAPRGTFHDTESEWTITEYALLLQKYGSKWYDNTHLPCDDVERTIVYQDAIRKLMNNG